MDIGFAPTWLHQVSPPASQNHFNQCCACVSMCRRCYWRTLICWLSALSVTASVRCCMQPRGSVENSLS